MEEELVFKAKEHVRKYGQLLRWLALCYILLGLFAILESLSSSSDQSSWVLLLGSFAIAPGVLFFITGKVIRSYKKWSWILGMISTIFLFFTLFPFGIYGLWVMLSKEGRGLFWSK